MSRAVPNPNITVRNFFIAVQEAGHWVLLQNCHLAASWLPTLDRLVASCAAAAEGVASAGRRPHRDYRLWLTAFPTAAFPVGVLQAAVKLTNEPPEGLRASLGRAFAAAPVVEPEFFHVGGSAGAAFRRLLYALVFLHVTLRERRRYGPLGWAVRTPPPPSFCFTPLASRADTSL